MGYKSYYIPNEYLKLNQDSNKLAIIFPGRGYTNQAPLLYYTARALLHSGYNVLNINYAYLGNSEFEAQSREEQMRWLEEDVSAAYQSAKDNIGAQIDFLVGKSLGTIALAHILETHSETRNMKSIWHTPLILSSKIKNAIRNYTLEPLLVIGTDDPHYDEFLLDELVSATKGEKMVIEEANHGMEVPGGPLAMLQIMTEVVERIIQYIQPI